MENYQPKHAAKLELPEYTLVRLNAAVEEDPQNITAEFRKTLSEATEAWLVDVAAGAFIIQEDIDNEKANLHYFRYGTLWGMAVAAKATSQNLSSVRSTFDKAGISLVGIDTSFRQRSETHAKINYASLSTQQKFPELIEKAVTKLTESRAHDAHRPYMINGFGFGIWLGLNHYQQPMIEIRREVENFDDSWVDLEIEDLLSNS